jgi:hypothetical protein
MVGIQEESSFVTKSEHESSAVALDCGYLAGSRAQVLPERAFSIAAEILAALCWAGRTNASALPRVF